MNWILALIALSACAELSSAKVIYCYYGSWAKWRTGAGQYTINNIDPNLCTHVAWSFVEVNTNGQFNLNGFDDDYQNFLGLKQRNGNVKLTISIGGWSQGSTTFSQLTNDPGQRGQLVDNIYNFITQHNLDGVDIDWEYPAQRGGAGSDKESYVDFLRQLREKFNQRGLVLTAAVEGDVDSSSYDVGGMNQYLDFFNVMTYDYVDGSEGNTGMNSPLNGIQQSIQGWLDAGASSDKILVGVPFYGHTYTLSNSGQTWVGAPASGPGNAGQWSQSAGMLEYYEICLDLNQGGWTTQWDNAAQEPYSFNGNQWIGYDNAQSLEAKCNYVNSNNFAGIIIWAVEGDDGHNSCGQGVNPLLNAVARTLNGNGGSAPAPAPAPAPAAPAQSSSSEHPSAPASSPSSSVGATCTQAGYMRNPSNCGVFYNCVSNGNGGFTQYPFNCPAGLYFDLNGDSCNYANQVSGC